MQKGWFISCQAACLVHASAQAPNREEHNASGFWKTRSCYFGCQLLPCIRVKMSQLQPCLAPGCRPCRPLLLRWTNTMVFSISVGRRSGPLSSMWQTGDADWARGAETWRSIGCPRVVSLTDMDIIECCQIWHLRLNQCLSYHRRILFWILDYVGTHIFSGSTFLPCFCFWRKE